ncbi:UNVERIFIED_CONTAM: putative receptor-like protein kinase [Sesamum radiatum]|uniref:Receptor-like protein kinase n=1 Tax=Sesamum radiatum TaxID=300843 RepID=A0AAW2KEM0_SESRA
MSWKLVVDPDFDYLVRLHFCELVYDKPNQRIFRIFVDNKTAADNFDIYVRAGGMNKAYHEDYVDSISSRSNTIWIQLGPDTTTGSAGTDALLNGLEVFKLSRNGNLAYVETYSNVKVKKTSRNLILWVSMEQGLKEFETEIEMLSKLRHRHLVSLIGFCDEQNEMILVYEYMANGTLRSHLFGSDLPSLSWKQRLEICIGAARGLHYLHTGSDRETGPSLEHTHVSTAVKGSFGYLDPEYFRRQQLTEKSDVYSFGVVLFEVVCARAVINPTLPKDQINLAEWAMRWQRKKSLESILDPQLKGNYSPESLVKFGEIAEKCLADEGKSRPTMGEVLWHLEYVLQLHEAWLRSNAGDSSFP